MRPGRVQEQPPPPPQQLLALLQPPVLQLLPQPPPRAWAPPAADPPLAAAPPPRGRGAAPPSRAPPRPPRPQQPGARWALESRSAPASRRYCGGLGAHFNAARSPGARGRLAARLHPIPSGFLAWETSAPTSGLCVVAPSPLPPLARHKSGERLVGPAPPTREQAFPGALLLPGSGLAGTRGPRVPSPGYAGGNRRVPSPWTLWTPLL